MYSNRKFGLFFSNVDRKMRIKVFLTGDIWSTVFTSSVTFAHSTNYEILWGAAWSLVESSKAVVVFNCSNMNSNFNDGVLFDRKASESLS